MDPMAQGPRRRTSRPSPPQAPPPPTPAFERAAALVRVIGSAADLEQWERMLTVLAVHSDGAGFERAQLMLWEPRTELLSARLPARGTDGSMPLGAALDRARIPQSTTMLADVGPLARAPSWSTAELAGPAAAAWHRGECAIAPAEVKGAWPGHPEVGAAPVRRGGRPFGIIVGEWPSIGEPGERLAALRAWASIAEASLAAFDHRREADHRGGHARALSELGRAIVSPLNLAELIHHAARLAVQGTAARGSALWLPSAKGTLRLEVTHGATGERERMGRALEPLAASVLASSKLRVIERAQDEMLLSPQAAAGIDSLVVLPLVAYGREVGVLAVYDRGLPAGERPVADPMSVQFLGSLGDVVALGLDQAARFEQLRKLEQRERELANQLRRQEGLAALGEAAGRIAQEACAPLASIRAFAHRLRGGLSEGDPHLEYLEIVLAEADRLERMLAEQRDRAAIEPTRMRLESLNGVVQEVLQKAGEGLVRRRIRLVKRLSPDVPALVIDVDRIRFVVGNILHNALEAVAIGGRIRVETRLTNQHAIVEVAHDGQHHPGDAMDDVFVPFANGRPHGSGVGLDVAQRVVHEHGGEIRVRSEGEWSTIIAFTVPVLHNQDRRRAGPERRQVGHDRRARFPTR